MNEFIVELSNISKSYGEKVAVNSISFTLSKGSILGLLGQNGAGKSTLIRILTQIITCDQGEIYYEQKPIDKSFLDKIGYLPEERGLYKKMKVDQNLLFFARLRGISKRDALSQIDYWLKRLDAYSFKNQRIEQLSKGMQQKVQLIATLLHDPEIIVLDEPFSGLDPVNAQLFKELFLEMKASGKSILLSSHDMNSVEELCDEIVLIHNSKVLLKGIPRKLAIEHFKGHYLVETSSPIVEELNNCTIISSKELGDDFQYVIKVSHNQLSNNLLLQLSEGGNVIKFERQLPTMNELFIEYTK